MQFVLVKLHAAALLLHLDLVESASASAAAADLSRVMRSICVRGLLLLMCIFYSFLLKNVYCTSWWYLLQMLLLAELILYNMVHFRDLTACDYYGLILISEGEGMGWSLLYRAKKIW